MTTSQDHIKKYVEEWAGSEQSPHFAVLLEGPWGCGKTHFVNSLIGKDNKVAGRKVIYLSLFGISDAALLQTQLFYASASNLTKWGRQGLGLVGSVFSASLSVGSGGIFGGSANLDKIIESAGDQIEKATKTLDGAILVLDDVERTHIPISELLGVVNRFVEHGDTRVILVANTDGFKDTSQKDSFQSFKEKIVGYSFVLSGDPDSVISEFVKQSSSSVLKSRREQISELYRLSGYGNLRALRQFLYFMSSLLAKIDAALFDNREFAEQFIKAAFILFFEYKLDLSEDSRVLSLRDIWDFDRSESDSSFDLGAFVGEGSETTIYYHHFNEDQPPPYGQTVLKKYSEFQMATVLPRACWRKVLEGQTVEAEDLNKFARSSLEVGWDQWPEWRRLWHFYQWNFDSESENQFWRDIDKLNAQITSGSYTHPKELLHVAGILLMLSDEGIIEEKQDDIVARMKSNIDEYVIPNLSSEIYRQVRRDFDTGYDGLGFIRSNEAEFEVIRSYLYNKMDAWNDKWTLHDAGLELIDYLPDRIKDFLGDIIVINYGEQRYLREPILHTIDPEKFVDKWFALERDLERGLVRNIEKRYQNNWGDSDVSGKDLLLAEAPWWRKVQTEILKRAQQIQSEFSAAQKSSVKHPRAAQIGHLIDGINRVIIDPWEIAQYQALKSGANSSVGWLLQKRITSNDIQI